MMKKIGAWANYAVLTLLLLLTLVPFYMLIITSLKYRDQVIHEFWLPSLPLHGSNYANAFVQLWPFLCNSVIVTAGIIICVLINASLAGYAFARFSFWGKSLLYYLIIMLMMVPSFLILIPQFILFKNLGLINTYWAQIFGPMAGASAMATMLIRTFFEGLSTGVLEAAEAEGAGDGRIYLQIALPLSMPILSTVAVINALLGWNNYVWPLVVTSGDKVKPVILALSSVHGSLDQVQGLQFAGYVISSVPLLLLFLLATRSFVSGITAGAVKG
ncbi:carbohydrate ABC transporter permease [Paenibacillus doosanensis]|uniref:carbohydrate ABC transporter permease n=1 Tax=Paenibacillus doosanensis TaxID=1229154 RepID=UPI0021800925|nr:carbohydrate ABC transporter permease [Paenibacillus doosanensis]MCS7462816.1 carbohydrate ABC transporter permease [Paenibacillus doosanensis]